MYQNKVDMIAIFFFIYICRLLPNNPGPMCFAITKCQQLIHLNFKCKNFEIRIEFVYLQNYIDLLTSEKS
jgi:hypothetical protein